MSRKSSRPQRSNKPTTGVGSRQQRVLVRQLPLRTGGAFMALGVFFIITAVFAVFANGIGAPYEVALPFLLLCVAALCVGASLRVQVGSPDNNAGESARQSRIRLILLVIAIVCVLLTRFVPSNSFFVMGQWWLLMYALLAICCGIVLRRAAIQPVN